LIEYLSLDEGYLDITHSHHLFGGPLNIAKEIKRRIFENQSLTASVGIGFSMMSAKIASEEKKPDGLFWIKDVDQLHSLILDRNASILPGIGTKTKEMLKSNMIHTVRDVLTYGDLVKKLLGKYGEDVVRLAQGVDNRAVEAGAAAKSIGKEHTFQKDITDFQVLKDVLLVISRYLAFQLHKKSIFAKTITLKVTYTGMERITRNLTGVCTQNYKDIFERACTLLDKVNKKPIRLIGISVSGLDDEEEQQINLFEDKKQDKMKEFDNIAFKLQNKYGLSKFKTAREHLAAKTMTDEGK
ncbi:MAG: DNA polymerase IV, partial [Defluviitaleaceae bacterium]|nr:DNA polymerase IV [Defluviitaleaceae bacterium]